jgi:hypothetical protein
VNSAAENRVSQRMIISIPGGTTEKLRLIFLNNPFKNRCQNKSFLNRAYQIILPTAGRNGIFIA